MKSTFAVLLLYFTVILAGGSAAVTWDNAGGDSNWFNSANWIDHALPGATDDVYVVTNGIGGPILTGSVAVLTLTISNKTLAFQGTNTILTTSNVTVAGTSGRITHSANTDTNGADGWQPDNLVRIICSNCTVATGAQINLDYMGYRGGTAAADGYGPGCGLYSSGGGGGAHGGSGGNGETGPVSGGATNGSPTEPFEPGSGGGGASWSGVGGAGGGAVWLQAVETVIIDGTITANGSNTAGRGGGGSGGGIYVSCHTLGGNGIVRANGGQVPSYGGGGGGGRIGVYFDEATNSTIQFLASDGSGYQRGRPGTLLLSQFNGVLAETWTGGLELWTNAWSPNSFTLSNSSAFAVFRPGFALNVTGEVRLVSGARMELGTNAALACTNLTLSGSCWMWLYTNATLSCTNLALSESTLGLSPNVVGDIKGGDLTLTGSTVYVYSEAGFTNVDEISLTGSSAIYSYSHTTSGVPPLPFVTRNFLVATNSQVNANSGGYGSVVSANGYGPGRGLYGSGGGGGGYGGSGGNGDGGAGGATNGSLTEPFDSGSGGGGATYSTVGGSGGGAVRIAATEQVEVNGTITANGGGGNGTRAGGGAGGGIYIRCQTVEGWGGLRANGGNGSTLYAGGGGGGRIAVHYVLDHFYGTYSVTNGTGKNNGSTGTIYRALQEGYLELKVEGHPEQHGDSSPYAYGSSGVASNSVITNSVTSPADDADGVRYACIGWTGTGNVTPSGTDTQVVFTMTADSTLEWLWTNQYYLTTTLGPNGSLAADMSGWYTNGTQVTVTASADANYHFTIWSGDVPFAERTNNPLTLTMDQVRAIQANFAADTGGDKIWVGGSSNWYSSEHWSPPGAPGELDAASITSAVTVTLLDCAVVRSLVLSNATLTFQGTNTILTASNVTVAGTSGRITHSANTDTNGADGWQPDNLVRIICSNCTVATGAQINLDYMGYRGGTAAADGYGPGCGLYSSGGGGGAHGGSGGNGETGPISGGATNGSPTEPFEPGSGGGGASWSGVGGAGGGAVWLQAVETVIIDGTITANGSNTAGRGGGGSGGGIYVSCHTLGGNGIVRANGGQVPSYGGGGGGGRIGVYFDEATNSTIQFLASDGSGYQRGRPGTLLLSQFNGVLAETWTGGLELWTNAWSPNSFTLSNSSAFAVFRPGFALNVTGEVRLVSGARMELGTNAALACTNLTLSESTLGLSPNVVGDIKGGDLTLTGSTVYVYSEAGFTNVDEISLTGSSAIYSYSHTTSGVPPLPFVTRNFLVATNSQVNANSGGYGSVVSANGYGPGRGLYGSGGGGGGYGGSGGNGDGGAGGATNGSLTEPFDSGSGGGGATYSTVGGSGGGAVRIAATEQVEVNGTITANGGGGNGTRAGGGAGGGIYVRCTTIKGLGAMQANGSSANALYAGGGGGGRIAVRCSYNHFYGTLSVTNGTGFHAGQVGTIYWRIQAPGTMLRVW